MGKIDSRNFIPCELKIMDVPPDIHSNEFSKKEFEDIIININKDFFNGAGFIPFTCYVVTDKPIPQSNMPNMACIAICEVDVDEDDADKRLSIVRTLASKIASITSAKMVYCISEVTTKVTETVDEIKKAEKDSFVEFASDPKASVKGMFVRYEAGKVPFVLMAEIEDNGEKRTLKEFNKKCDALSYSSPFPTTNSIN